MNIKKIIQKRLLSLIFCAFCVGQSAVLMGMQSNDQNLNQNRITKSELEEQKAIYSDNYKKILTLDIVSTLSILTSLSSSMLQELYSKALLNNKVYQIGGQLVPSSELLNPNKLKINTAKFTPNLKALSFALGIAGVWVYNNPERIAKLTNKLKKITDLIEYGYNNPVNSVINSARVVKNNPEMIIYPCALYLLSPLLKLQYPGTKNLVISFLFAAYLTSKSEIARLESKMNTRFDTVDDKIDLINKNVLILSQTTDIRFDNLDTAVAQLGNNVTDVLQNQAALKTSFDEFEKLIEKVTQELLSGQEGIETQLGTLNSNIQCVTRKLDISLTTLEEEAKKQAEELSKQMSKFEKMQITVEESGKKLITLGTNVYVTNLLLGTTANTINKANKIVVDEQLENSSFRNEQREQAEKTNQGLQLILKQGEDNHNTNKKEHELTRSVLPKDSKQRLTEQQALMNTLLEK